MSTVKPFDVADLKTWTCGKCAVRFSIGKLLGSHGGEPHRCPECGRHFYSGQSDSGRGPVSANVYIDKHPWSYE